MLSFLTRIYEWFFGCQHAALSRVFTLEHRSYKVCYDCGREFNYSLEQMKMTNRPQPAKPVGSPELRPAARQAAPARVFGRVRA
jgi:hypothetical protein